MAEKKRSGDGYRAFRKALADDNIERAYVFCGEERYLLEHSLSELRKKLVPEGMEEFNHRRFEGRGLTLDTLSEAVDALPVFAERTLVEVHDYDFSRLSEEAREELLALLTDLPDYVCLVFVYDTAEFKLDRRVKANAAIGKKLTVVEFGLQEKADLILWIGKRFRVLGKTIDRDTAEYLAFISGGLMTQLVTEIEKTAAYAKGERITREDIDAVVTPVLDAVVYRMTDALADRRFDEAAAVLSDLLGMNEPPHKILYSVSMKLRQLLAARVCLDEGMGTEAFMELAGVKYDFQAKRTMSAARRLSRGWCTRAVSLASETALRLNSGGEGKECLTDLLLRLAGESAA